MAKRRRPSKGEQLAELLKGVTLSELQQACRAMGGSLKIDLVDEPQLPPEGDELRPSDDTLLKFPSDPDVARAELFRIQEVARGYRDRARDYRTRAQYLGEQFTSLADELTTAEAYGGARDANQQTARDIRQILQPEEAPPGRSI